MTTDIRHLLESIENGTPEEAWEAAKQLESFSNEIVSFLLRVLQNGKSEEARAAASYVLGFGRYALARTVLEQALNDTRQGAFVRGHAAEALAYIGDPRSTAVLLNNLKDNEPGVQYWCAFALGQIGSAQAIPALEDMAERAGGKLYGTHALRAEALDAIAKINQHAREGELP